MSGANAYHVIGYAHHLILSYRMHSLYASTCLVICICQQGRIQGWDNGGHGPTSIFVIFYT
jgi:hypothetical protein